VREASRQEESKDPYQLGITLGDARNVWVVIAIVDKHDTQHLRIASREAAACESPARKCRVSSTRRDKSRRDVTLAPLTTIQ